jgi:hypothetical protein
MTLTVHKGDALKDITGMAVRKGGALRTITAGYVRIGGALKQFYALLTIALSTYVALGRGNSASVVNVTSEPVTALLTGAVGTVSYAWARTDGAVHGWTINSPTSASTTFSTLCDQGEQFTATFKCTATDQAGQVIASSDVSVDCANIYYGGGYPGRPGGGPGSVYP